MVVRALLLLCLSGSIVHADPIRLAMREHTVELREVMNVGSTALVLDAHARVYSPIVVDLEVSQFRDAYYNDVFGNPSFGFHAIVYERPCFAIWAGLRGMFSIQEDPAPTSGQVGGADRKGEAMEMYLSFDRFDRYNSVRLHAGYEQQYNRIHYIAWLALGQAEAKRSEYGFMNRVSRVFFEHAQEVQVDVLEALFVGARFTLIAADEPFDRNGGDSWRTSGTTTASLGPFVGVMHRGRSASPYARLGVHLGFLGAASGMGDLSPLISIDLRAGAVF